MGIISHSSGNVWKWRELVARNRRATSNEKPRNGVQRAQAAIKAKQGAEAWS